METNASAGQINAALAITSEPLSIKETQQILTPFAFKLDESLMGLKLATPASRAFALLIDIFLIAILSEMPGEILAIVIAIALYRYGKMKDPKRKGRKRRAIVRLFSIFLIFITLFSWLPELLSDSQKHKSEQAINQNSNDNKVRNNAEFIGLMADFSIIALESECIDAACWFTQLKPPTKALAQQQFDNNSANELISSAVEVTELTKEAQQKLSSQLYQYYLQQQSEKAEYSESKVPDLPKQESITKMAEKDEKADKAKPEYSIIAWAKALIEDLGLGFGWAAFYFTVFTSLWHGQTPGKKLFKIRVLQLDGTPLSLFDSFGRYGGYGAGLATGLLGFIQIFWDANRQAIHDKISSTVVVKYPFQRGK
jgi:hypothetical protein